jgi:hypothetical protein
MALIQDLFRPRSKRNKSMRRRTIPSEAFRRQLRSLLHVGVSPSELSKMLGTAGKRPGLKTLDRVLDGETTNTHPIAGAATVQFDYLVDGKLPGYNVARVSHHLHFLMANARRDKRSDDLIAIIETSESHIATHRSAVTGFASATLDLLDGVSKCSRVMSSWNTVNDDHKLTLLGQARDSFLRCIEVSRHLAKNADNSCYIQLALVPAYENLLFVSEEIDERTYKIAFNKPENPRTVSRETASQLVEWGALQMLREYATTHRCLVVAYNLADFAALISKDEAVKAWLLCFQLSPPDEEGNWMLPEMTDNPRAVGYLSASYEEALAKWKSQQEKKARTTNPRGAALSLAWGILTYAVGVGVAMFLGISELVAKGILH